jgi:hypothetical protein
LFTCTNSAGEYTCTAVYGGKAQISHGCSLRSRASLQVEKRPPSQELAYRDPKKMKLSGTDVAAYLESLIGRTIQIDAEQDQVFSGKQSFVRVWELGRQKC